MNLSRTIGHWAGLTPERCAIHFQGESISYAALWRQIDVATAVLSRRFAVKPGQRIAWLGLNHPDFIVFLMALARLGAIAVPLNFRLAPAELAAILSQAGVRLLLCDVPMRAAGDAAAHGAGLAVESIAPTTAISEEMETLVHQRFPGDYVGHERVEDAGAGDLPVLIVYTSGTTGKAKGAVHTQANLLWNIESAVDAQGISAHDHLLNVLPMFHVGGLCIQMLPVLSQGGTVTLHARFDPGAWIADVAARRPTLSLLVPATLKAILDHPDWPGADLSSLRFINTGSSAIPRALIDAVHARGVPVSQVYGATETGPVSIVLRPEDAQAKAGSAGKPALHVEARLVKPDGVDCVQGETGEIWIRGKNVVAGYWNDPGNEAFAGGWFHSGDLAFRDEEGFYWVVGRSSDMIISGGENIYPAEIENILADCAAIAEAAVIGAADEKWGEVAIAVIVRKPGAELDAAAVMQLFEGRIARYKHPRRVVFADALPKTALGKVKREELRGTLAMTKT